MWPFSSSKAETAADGDDSLDHSLVSQRGSLPLVYSADYNIGFMGLESLHPFDSKKYGRIHDGLLGLGLISASSAYRPRPPNQRQLLTVHPASYLESLSSASVARMVEVAPVAMLPFAIVRRHVLEPMLLATGGSMLAGELAMQQLQEADRQRAAGQQSSSSLAWAINLSGGYHHASAERGGGFCIYADISLTALHVHRRFPAACSRVLIVDLDAHQGNGHETDCKNGLFKPPLELRVFDMFNASIYPHDIPARAGIRYSVPLASGTADAEYLSTLRTRLSAAMEDSKPQLVIYNAGTDCLDGDPLGALRLSRRGVIERDEFVFSLCRDHRCAVVMLLSGGYQRVNAEVITESIANLRSRFSLWEASSH